MQDYIGAHPDILWFEIDVREDALLNPPEQIIEAPVGPECCWQSHRRHQTRVDKWRHEQALGLLEIILNFCSPIFPNQKSEPQFAGIPHQVNKRAVRKLTKGDVFLFSAFRI
jgi:hypothetical protein